VTEKVTAATRKTRTITVDQLARVEGEGGLTVCVRDGRVSEVRLEIFEPPRFFEALLRGRPFGEVPDITARICGICPVAYQMSSCHAIERAFGVTVGGGLRDLRRLLYMGEWIESHALHVFMLHAPDFLGYESAIHMAKDHPQVVTSALALKKVGNELMQVVGGRSVHPVNVKVGGFYKLPDAAELAAVCERLRWARDEAVRAVRWLATLDCPVFTRDYTLVAMQHPDEYPVNEGRLVSTRGLSIAPHEYEQRFSELHVEHSTALQSRLDGKSYLVGPLARFALNYATLSPLARDEAQRAGIGPDERNPFRSILVRGVELVYACDEAVRLIESYRAPDRASVDVNPRAGVGHAWTEAPRGTLWHKYRLAGDGSVEDAKIVPPTSQNQRSMEEDLAAFVAPRLALSDEALRWQCEQAVRNYDPCISCSTHFLKLTRTVES
jgi:sulfhydrogenase subunit alpha